MLAAAFVLAARAYFYELDAEDAARFQGAYFGHGELCVHLSSEVADFLYIGVGTVKTRMQECLRHAAWSFFFARSLFL